MKKFMFLMLAVFLLVSAIALPVYSAVVNKPVVVITDDDPLPVPPPPHF